MPFIGYFSALLAIAAVPAGAAAKKPRSLPARGEQAATASNNFFYLLIENNLQYHILLNGEFHP